MLAEKLKKHRFAPVFSFELKPQNTLVLDLSKSNEDEQFQKIASVADLDKYIEDQLRKHDKKYGYGGYGENRAIYSRFSHFNNSSSAERHYHLGVDIWAPAYTEIFAPCPSRIHSFAFNGTMGDYGGTIILQHHLQNETFYSLYGHLSKKSLENRWVGQHFEAGEKFAELGEEHENVGWPPHLHFQVIKDIADYQGDYPGVAAAENRLAFLKNCPNPNLVLGIDF